MDYSEIFSTKVYGPKEFIQPIKDNLVAFWDEGITNQLLQVKDRQYPQDIFEVVGRYGNLVERPRRKIPSISVHPLLDIEHPIWCLFRRGVYNNNPAYLPVIMIYFDLINCEQGILETFACQHTQLNHGLNITVQSKTIVAANMESLTFALKMICEAEKEFSAVERGVKQLT